jgi:hypothetical protein
MKRKKRTEITVESELVLVRRSRRDLIRAWCASCAEQVSMLTVDHAAAVARVTARTIYRWVEAGQVHFKETPEGSLLICLNSLSKKPINEQLNKD